MYPSRLWWQLVPHQARRVGQGHGMGRWWEPSAALTCTSLLSGTKDWLLVYDTTSTFVEALDSWWSVGLLAGYGALHYFGVGWVADGLLASLMFAIFGTKTIDAIGHVGEFISKAAAARNDQELDEAAMALAKAAVDLLGAGMAAAPIKPLANRAIKPKVLPGPAPAQGTKPGTTGAAKPQPVNPDVAVSPPKPAVETPAVPKIGRGDALPNSSKPPVPPTAPASP